VGNGACTVASSENVSGIPVERWGLGCGHCGHSCPVWRDGGNAALGCGHCGGPCPVERGVGVVRWGNREAVENSEYDYVSVRGHCGHLHRERE
jgi:hypothetical protein